MSTFSYGAGFSGLKLTKILLVEAANILSTLDVKITPSIIGVTIEKNSKNFNFIM